MKSNRLVVMNAVCGAHLVLNPSSESVLGGIPNCCEAQLSYFENGIIHL